MPARTMNGADIRLRDTQTAFLNAMTVGVFDHNTAAPWMYMHSVVSRDLVSHCEIMLDAFKHSATRLYIYVPVVQGPAI